ncbi:MAG: DUF1844 domain-containing protein [Myxococcota bacterium]|nr:DUF1844 domain-containing protein [Myxococcota bacterium]
MADESGAGASDQPKASSELPAIDFSTFVLSLSTTALYQMGLLADPETHEKASPNREIAQQTIYALEMLREKTRGNLEDEEAKLLDSLLYELRLRFVELDA